MKTLSIKEQICVFGGQSEVTKGLLYYLAKGVSWLTKPGSDVNSHELYLKQRVQL